MMKKEEPIIKYIYRNRVEDLKSHQDNFERLYYLYFNYLSELVLLKKEYEEKGYEIDKELTERIANYKNQADFYRAEYCELYLHIEYMEKTIGWIKNL